MVLQPIWLRRVLDSCGSLLRAAELLGQGELPAISPKRL